MIALGILLTIAVSLVFPGIIAITKARLGGRKGPGIFQPLLDIIRLFKKGSVYSHTTSIVFQAAPVIYVASILVALLFIPFGQTQGLLSFEGDFVFFASVLAIGKFLLIIGAMDTGSGFEGMGANREALYSMLVEPAFFILMGSIALLTKHTSFHDIYAHLYLNSYLSRLIAIVGIYLFGLIALVENSRLPIDDPATHLELTMVHEVMILDNSGFDMAILHLASGFKFALYGALIANFMIPSEWALGGQIFVFLLAQFLFAFGIGALESFRARNKMAKNPQWILTLSAISLIGFLTAMIITHNFILN
jgi:formate hydrogenlyase subunit 4